MWRCCRRPCTTPSDPARAIAEAARIVVPGGRVLLLDLREHNETWVRERLGDRWTGFSEEKLRGLLADAGLETDQGHRRRTTHRRSIHCADCQRRETNAERATTSRRSVRSPPRARRVTTMSETSDTREPAKPAHRRSPAMHPHHRHGDSARAAREAPARARWRDGNDDSALQADRRGLPRRAVQGSSRTTRRATATCW